MEKNCYQLRQIKFKSFDDAKAWINEAMKCDFDGELAKVLSTKPNNKIVHFINGKPHSFVEIKSKNGKIYYSRMILSKKNSKC